MTIDRGALAALLATMTVLATATPAVAQTEPAAPVRGLERLQSPGTQATPDANAIPVPAAPTIVLPNAAPAPRRTPRSSASAKPATDRATTKRAGVERPTTEAPTRERAAPRTTTEPTTQPRAPDVDPTRASTSAEPAPVATPTPEPALQSPPTQNPATEVASQPSAPTPIPVPESTLSVPEKGSAMPLWLSLTAIVVVLGALWALRRKPRRHRYESAEPEAYVEPTPLPIVANPAAPKTVASEPVSSPAAATPVAASTALPVAVAPAAAPKFLEPRGKVPPPPPVVARARLSCELRPLRAGLNLLSATVECEMVVTNTGTAPAESIRAGIALLTAHADQDIDLAAFNAAPVVRPSTPPFALAPGETRTIRTVTAIAREAIRTMTAANRPMFVPVVATNILYVTAGDEAQTARAWVVGIERVDSPKLAPFWLDAPARMYTTVAARPHAVTFDR
ncbi:hypothetical protein [Sphingomonas sp. OK281]|uniref:hypothetical protein n=1 Tax=Sphingomonas sp. OK281 TaxID=1881067 RepID=UPI0008E594D2|nr:hypothetical protein [Sphingomonas sp. OK281]SFN69137.1 hypothetical protein SAMN05428984_0183 [Sphingomonas sp. OK281]